MRKILALCFLLCASICLGQNHCYGGANQQMCTNYQVGGQTLGTVNLPIITYADQIQYATAHDVWHSSTTAPVLASVTAGFDLTGGLDSSGNIYLFDGVNTWTKQVAMGTVHQFAIADRSDLFALLSNQAPCNGWPTGTYQTAKLVNGSWSGGWCMYTIAAAQDGSVVSVGGGHTVWLATGFSLTNYTQLGTLGNVTQCSVGSAAYIACTDGSVHKWANGAWSTIPGVTGVTEVAIDSNGTLYAHGGNSYIYHYNGSGWDQLLGGPVSSLTTGGSMNTWAVASTLGTSNVWRFPNKSATLSATLSGNTTCGSGGCPSGAKHQGQITAQFVTLSAGGQTTTGPPVDPPTFISLTAQDTSHDIFSCLENGFLDQKCLTQGPGNNPPRSDSSVLCTAAGGVFTEFITAVLPPACIIPRKNIGWSDGGNVNVYINAYDYPYGSIAYIGIVAGIRSWYPANFITYIPLMTNGVPTPEPTQRYIYVSKQTGSVGENNPCGPYNKCPAHSGANLFNAWMKIANNLTTLAQYTGEAAHEEGHDNFLDNCDFSCPTGGSVMGPQPTNSLNQPQAPTICDLFWYITWYNL